MINKQFFQKIIDYGLLAILIIFPLSINIALISPKDQIHPLIAVNLSLADVFIGAVLLLWLLKIIIYKEWKETKLPPYPILIFLGIGVISFVDAFSLSLWLKETIKLIEYFGLFYILLTNNLKRLRFSNLTNILFISSTIILVVAFIQHSFLNGDLYLVRGLFENKNNLGSFLCIVVPLIYAELLHTSQFNRKVWMAFLLLIAFIVLTSGSAILSLFIGLLAINWFYSKKIFFRVLIIFLVIFSLYPFIMPQKNTNAIKEFASIYEQGSISEKYYCRLTMVANRVKNQLFRKDIGENYLYITTDKFLNVILPQPQKGEAYKEMEGKKHIKNRYMEMQASLNIMADHTFIGIGLGNFQNFIGTYYKELPKVNTAEPNQNNTYMLIGATTGILGLTAFLWILGFFIKETYNKFRSNKNNVLQNLGLLGALIACCVEGFFSYIFASFLLVPLVLLFYLCLKDSIIGD
jgi:hypothetical protein